MRTAALGAAVCATLAGAAAAGAVQEAAGPAVDPFYTGLLQEGIRSLVEGNHENAARDLRIACFGLLEDPPLLARCLVHLGLAQAAVEDREGFSSTFQRLATVERRFSGYTRADLSLDVRAAYEQQLVRWVHREQLAAAPAFSRLAVRQEAARIASLPPARRREELARRRAQEPGTATWTLLLAELEIEEGNPGAAVALSREALAAEPSSREARCLLGLARSEQGACAQALGDLATCPFAADEARYAEAVLRCRVALEQMAEAADFADSLPSRLRQERRIARLVREIERSPAADRPTGAVQARDAGAAGVEASGPEADRSAGTPQPEEAAGAGSAAAADPGGGRTSPALTPAERETLERARRALREIRFAGELEEPLREARRVADAHPELAEVQHLVARIAYRASRWEAAATYFRRGGDPGDHQPVLLFYMAVSLYEAGAREEAAAALRRALPRLEKTPFVASYADRILGTAGGPTDQG